MFVDKKSMQRPDDEASSARSERAVLRRMTRTKARWAQRTRDSEAAIKAAKIDDELPDLAPEPPTKAEGVDRSLRSR
jgi:hypothetical protein